MYECFDRFIMDAIFRKCNKTTSFKKLKDLEKCKTYLIEYIQIKKLPPPIDAKRVIVQIEGSEMLFSNRFVTILSKADIQEKKHVKCGFNL